ncbi:hypothetical protein A9X00_28090 [Mycobacterium sp. 1245805.9]|nr:hypothetical protein A9X00_28090 [Mycobacterium sp. 1245805.9]
MAGDPAGHHVGFTLPRSEIDLTYISCDERPQVTAVLKWERPDVDIVSHVCAKCCTRAAINLDGKLMAEARLIHRQRESACAGEQLDARADMQNFASTSTFPTIRSHGANATADG